MAALSGRNNWEYLIDVVNDIQRILVIYNDLHCYINKLVVRTFDIVFLDIKMLAGVNVLIVCFVFDIQGTTSTLAPDP